MSTGLIHQRPADRAVAERMQKPLVLVVDDDRRQAEFRAELLSQAGCTTVVCSSVQEAATTIGDLLRLDLVLTDLHLTRAGEDRSGLVVAHKARERFVGIPVVGLVPFGTSDLLDDGDRSGFSAVMEKGVRNLPELKVLTDQLAGLARNHLASKLRSRA